MEIEKYKKRKSNPRSFDGFVLLFKLGLQREILVAEVNVRRFDCAKFANKGVGGYGEADAVIDGISYVVVGFLGDFHLNDNSRVSNLKWGISSSNPNSRLRNY